MKKLILAFGAVVLAPLVLYQSVPVIISLFMFGDVLPLLILVKSNEFWVTAILMDIVAASSILIDRNEY